MKLKSSIQAALLPGITPHERFSSTNSFLRDPQISNCFKRYSSSTIMSLKQDIKKRKEREGDATLVDAPSAKKVSLESSEEDDTSYHAVFDDLSTATNDFTIDVLSHLNTVKSLQGKNVVVSPFNAFHALSMLLAGLDGDSLKQLESVLHTTKQNLLNNASSIIPLDQCMSSTASVWISDKIKVLQEYLDVLKSHFGADANPINFAASTEAANRINSWIASNTDGKIQNMLPASSITNLTRLVLVAATHFHGKWLHPFKHNDTDDEADFQLLDGSRVNVSMMNQTQSFKFAHLTKSLSGISLPYKDSRSRMVILLPASNASWNGLLEDKASLVRYFTESNDWKSHPVSVKLPKFEFHFAVDLAQSIEQLGASDLFDASKLNLAGVLEHGSHGHDIFVSNIFHQAWISVDELGTEAAAATAVLAKKRKRESSVERFFCDRPFIFGIVCDNKISFIGKMMNPIELQ